MSTEVTRVVTAVVSCVSIPSTVVRKDVTSLASSGTAATTVVTEYLGQREIEDGGTGDLRVFASFETSAVSSPAPWTIPAYP